MRTAEPARASRQAAEDRNVVRDYFVAMSEHAGVLYIFQTRLSDDEGAWYVHGTFA